MNYLWNALAIYDAEFLALIVSAAVKATFLLAFVALLCLAFRRFSAATRHLLWTSALCAALLLPFLSFVKIWEVPILPASVSFSDAPVSNDLSVSNQSPQMSEARNLQGSPVSSETINEAQRKHKLQTNAESLNTLVPPTDTSKSGAAQQKNGTTISMQIAKWTLAIWVVGALLFLFRLLIGLAATNLLVRRAVKFKEPELNDLFSSLTAELDLKHRVRLLHSERTAMPIVCGILRPAVLLPSEALAWSEERQRMVLLHELAHVARRDCLTQMLAQTACAFYWFNPFVWSAARRLRVEREQACDDYVLSLGTKPSDYAHHLLEIARSMQERSVFEWSQTTSVAMARQSQLEGRLLSILRKESKSAAMSRAVTFGLVALIGFLLISLAVIRPTAISAQKSPSSETTSKDEEGKTEKSLLDSFLAIGSAAIDDKTIQNSETDENAKKQNDVLGEDSLEQVIDEKQIEKDVEESLKQDLKDDLGQSISESVEQEVAETVQPPGTPALPPSPPAGIDPYVNIEFQPERKRQTQNQSGDFIEEMASVGYTNLSIDQLVKLKQADVTAEYVRSLRALGFTNLTVNELASMGIHGVTANYIQVIRSAGYENLPVKDIVAFRIHDITPQYIKSLRDAGYGNLPANQLTSFGVHEVTPAFISGMRAAGFDNLSPKDLVSLRVHDITPEFVRKAKSRLGELNIKQIISLKNAEIIEDDKD